MGVGGFWGDEEELVDERSDGGAGEGAEPIDPVVPPPPADEGRSEGPGGVHGGAVEGAAGEHVGAEDEADGQWRDGAQVTSLRVDRRRVNGVHQPKGHRRLQ